MATKRFASHTEGEILEKKYITHIIVYNHQILCKCIISYHTITVRSLRLLFFILFRV
jgi:hypothetical protein